ncbi:MAG: SDR family oxidoreductase [Mycobacteriales bacterium]
MRLQERLSGTHVLLTGATGFVGQAFLERLLADLPGTRVTLVVRSAPGETAEVRVRELLSKPAFGPLRERLGAQTVDGWLGNRVRVVEGELGRLLGELPDDIDVVVHCAGEVSFDPPLHEGFRTNVLGTLELLEAVRATGVTPHVVHVSTAYVAGLRSGWVPEGRHPHTLSWQAEQLAAEQLAERADVDSRDPDLLDRLRGEAAPLAVAGPQAVATETERLRLRWVGKRLVEAGRQRARSLGWADCYTMTKALAERAVEELCADWGVPLSICRPTIIESALERPYPGWIEGFKMAEPVILSYGRGELPDFPGPTDAPIDIIPVDLVTGAMLAMAASPPPPGQCAYYQVGSSARNPLRVATLYALVREYFTVSPLPQRSRGHITVPEWVFPGDAAIARRLELAERAHRTLDRALGSLPPIGRLRTAIRQLDDLENRLKRVRKLFDLYRDYACAELVYADDNTLALHERLDPEDQAVFGFDAEVVDWRHYLVDLHCPTVTSLLRWSAELPEHPPPSRVPVQAHPSGRAVAAFDMDGTLLPATVVEALLWAKLADAPLGRWPRELAAVARALPGILSAERRNRGQVVRRTAEMYDGADLEALAALVDQEVAGAVLSKVSAAALRTVREHRAAGHRTVLVTGALDVFARPIAPLFDEILAATLQVGPDGRATGRLAAPPATGDARAAWLVRRAHVDGWDLRASHGYADSASDLPMLRAVGHPVAVNPDRQLARVAAREKWPVERWRSTPGAARLLAVGAR